MISANVYKGVNRSSNDIIDTGDAAAALEIIIDREIIRNILDGNNKDVIIKFKSNILISITNKVLDKYRENGWRIYTKEKGEICDSFCIILTAM